MELLSWSPDHNTRRRACTLDRSGAASSAEVIILSGQFLPCRHVESSTGQSELFAAAVSGSRCHFFIIVHFSILLAPPTLFNQVECCRVLPFFLLLLVCFAVAVSSTPLSTPRCLSTPFTGLLPSKVVGWQSIGAYDKAPPPQAQFVTK